MVTVYQALTLTSVGISDGIGGGGWQLNGPVMAIDWVMVAIPPVIICGGYSAVYPDGILLGPC